MVNGKSIPGQNGYLTYSAAAQRGNTYDKDAFNGISTRKGKGSGKGKKGDGKGGKGTSRGQSSVWASKNPPDPTRSVNADKRAAAANAFCRVPNWICENPRCGFPHNDPLRPLCKHCSAPMPKYFRSNVLKHLEGGGDGPTADPPAKEATDSATHLLFPKLQPKTIQAELQEAEKARAYFNKYDASQVDKDRVEAEVERLRNLKYASKADDEKVRFHEVRIKDLEDKIEAHPDKSQELQAAVDKAKLQVVRAQEALDKHIPLLEDWRNRLQRQRRDLALLKSLMEGKEETEEEEEVLPTEDGCGTPQNPTMQAALEALARARPEAPGLAEAITLISQILAGNGNNKKADDPMGDNHTRATNVPPKTGVSSGTAQTGDAQGPSIEQIEDQIAQEANATRLAREEAEQHKAETEQQIRLEQQRQAEAATREGHDTLEAQGGDENPLEPANEADVEQQQQQEAVRQQALRALEAQQTERAEAEAEKARAADTLRLLTAKHAHDGDTQGSKGPKILRATQGEAETAAETEGNTDAAHSAGKSQGKGKPCGSEENKPY